MKNLTLLEYLGKSIFINVYNCIILLFWLIGLFYLILFYCKLKRSELIWFGSNGIINWCFNINVKFYSGNKTSSIFFNLTIKLDLNNIENKSCPI